MYEGWYVFSQSWRNNNPGNLRNSPFQIGTRNGFARFDGYAAGWLALWYDLWAKCTAHTKTRLTPDSTLYDLFNVWAPASDSNHPKKYAETVAMRLSVPPTTKLSYFVADFPNV